jgi:hypothetical protein
MLTLEMGPDREPTTCKCCGGILNSVHGFIYSDGDAYAIYFFAWSESHPGAGVDLALEPGSWEESSIVDVQY